MYNEEGNIDGLLYSYWKKNGGCLVGDPENGNYPSCEVLLDLDKVPIVVSSIVISSSQYGFGMHCAARMQVELRAPFHLEILPMNVLRKGIDLLAKEDICVREPQLDKKYLIKGDLPEFIKMFLPGSGAAALLEKTKLFSVRIDPIGNEKTLHTLQVACMRNVGTSGVFSQSPELADIGMMVDLCREMYEAVTRFPMPEKE